MEITKIHPIKSTLNLAIAYITNEEKTDEKILVSANKCFASTTHTAFMNTREDNKVNGTVLARHFIQSFIPIISISPTSSLISLKSFPLREPT